MPEATPLQIELATRAWFNSMQRIWARRNPGVPFPGGGYDALDPTSRRLFHKSMEVALRAGSPDNAKNYQERQLQNNT